jgi:hypothetical protein
VSARTKPVTRAVTTLPFYFGLVRVLDLVPVLAGIAKADVDHLHRRVKDGLAVALAPDRGGEHEGMVRLNAAVAALRELLREVVA